MTFIYKNVSPYEIDSLPAKVTIQTENGVVVARGLDGVVKYSDDLTTVIEYVMANSLTSGRTWQETIRIIGNYEIDDRIEITSDYVRLEIDGRIKVADGVAVNSAFVIWASEADNCSISGGVLDSNGTNHDGTVSGYHQFAIKLDDCDDWLFENVTVLNAGRDAFLFDGGSTRIRCINCVSDGAEDDGFNPLDSHDCQFINCVAKNSTYDGFHLSVGSEDCTIIGGISSGNGNYGLEVISNNALVYGLTCRGIGHVNGDAGAVTIENCTFDGTGFDDHTVQISGVATEADHVIFANNRINGTPATKRSLYLVKRNSMRIINNVITAVTAAPAAYGIFVQEVDRTLLSGNIVQGEFTTAGIRLYGDCNDSTVRDSYVDGTVASLVIDGGCDDTRLSNNIMVTAIDDTDGSTATVTSTYA